MGRSFKPTESMIALYGTTPIQRAFCSVCASYAFVIDGKLQCCERPYAAPAKEDQLVRFSESERKRKKPPPWWKKKTIAEQRGRCFYCGRRFGTVLIRKNKETTLGVHWDHVEAWCFAHDNRLFNFVASCSLCNLFKSNKSFYSIESIRDYLMARWSVEEIEILYDPPSVEG